MNAKRQDTQNSGWYRFNIGELECTSIWDGYIHHGYEGIFPNADPAELARLQKDYRLPEDHIPMDLNPVVVNLDGKLVLIDAGMGTASEMFGPHMGRLVANMRAAGIAPEDIDVILMTHLHPDHSFGLINPDGTAVFDKAELYCCDEDWAEWTDESNLARDDFRKDWTAGTLQAVAPYRDRLKLFKAGDTLFPGVTAVSVAGHAAGMCAFIFESAGEKIVFTGDVCHHHVYDLYHPEWFFHMDYDTDPAQGAAAKSVIFRKVVEENIRFHGYHFPFPGLGDVVDHGDGSYRFFAQPFNPRLE